MDSHEYERAQKEGKALQQQIDSKATQSVIGNIVRFPFTVVGLVVKVVATLVLIMVLIAVVASTIEVAATGKSSALEWLRGM